MRIVVTDASGAFVAAVHAISDWSIEGIRDNEFEPAIICFHIKHTNDQTTYVYLFQPLGLCIRPIGITDSIAILLKTVQ